MTVEISFLFSFNLNFVNIIFGRCKNVTRCLLKEEMIIIMI